MRLWHRYRMQLDAIRGDHDTHTHTHKHTRSLWKLQSWILIASYLAWPNVRNCWTVVKHWLLPQMRRSYCTAHLMTMLMPLLERGLTIEPVRMACTVWVSILRVPHVNPISTPANSQMWKDFDHRPSCTRWFLCCKWNQEEWPKAALRSDSSLGIYESIVGKAWPDQWPPQQRANSSRVCDIWPGTGLSLLHGAVQRLRNCSWAMLQPTWSIRKHRCLIQFDPICAYDPLTAHHYEKPHGMWKWRRALLAWQVFTAILSVCPVFHNSWHMQVGCIAAHWAPVIRSPKCQVLLRIRDVGTGRRFFVFFKWNGLLLVFQGDSCC